MQKENNCNFKKILSTFHSMSASLKRTLSNIDFGDTEDHYVQQPPPKKQKLSRVFKRDPDNRNFEFIFRSIESSSLTLQYEVPSCISQSIAG